MSDEWPPARPSQRPGGYDPPPGYQTGAQQSFPHGPGYGPQPPPYPPRPYPVTDPEIEAGQGSAVGALVVSLITMLLCSMLTNAIGMVFAVIAMSEKHDVERFRRFTRYAWISNWIHIGLVGLGIVAFVAFFAVMIATAP
ncbi:hypothetical protein [Nocardiopsis potens]|uniref:hypothetical protein n=1 Tax=Nocardiopsis potens TaxID=1246458 RepID=UPI00034CEE4A|nr:hypothetical protein [Nocardiopsis potens]